MRTMLKKVMTVLTAGVLATGAASLAACGSNFKTPTGIPQGEVKSNGGFVVEAGEYVYFINGVETYTSDNTYGTPVKGSLMRATVADIKAGKNDPETVIPSLMVASDYNSGLFIYGDRVYYATPNNNKNMQGVVENSFLDFKSAKLDGTDIQTYFNVSSNSTVYRFVNVGNTVYVLYVDGSDLHSYNTVKKEDVTLVKSMDAYVLNSGLGDKDKEDPYVYYTMSVTADIDVVDGSYARNYKQIYRVRADVTEAPAEYDYDWNEEYLKENDDVAPYLNLGEIVLDGIGMKDADKPQRFTHEAKTESGALTAENMPDTAAGYTYTLQSYRNGGIYFTRSDLATTSSQGEDGWLYYLPVSALGDYGAASKSWNSIKGNSVPAVISQNTTNASASAIFYTEGGEQYYLYVGNSTLYRARVNGNQAPELQPIQRNVGSATLITIDDTSDSKYHYVYYNMSGNIWRAVYNGTAEDYKSLNDYKDYKAVQVLDVQHATGWYGAEVVDGILYYADAKTLGSGIYTYTTCVNLTKDGKLMDNIELADFGKQYNKAYMGEDSYYEELQKDGKNNLATAVEYYLTTGETEQFYDNIAEAEKETGKKNTLYSEEEVKAFEDFVKQTDVKFRSDFILRLGKISGNDEEAIGEYWKTTLQHYTASAEEPSALPGWAWALIGIGIGLVVIGAGVVVYFVLRSRKKEEAEPKRRREFVDTTDDRDVDVYADAKETPAAPAEEAVETLEEPVPAEEPVETAEEPVPAEEPVETSEEPAPAEEPAETSEETPKEE